MRTTAGFAAVVLVAASAVADPRRETPVEGRPAFEAATIKLAAPGAVRNQLMATRPNRLSIPSMTLTWLIYAAYGDGGFNTSMRVTGGPDWIRTGLTDRYTMELDYPFAPLGPAASAAPPEFAGPALPTAVREQWGLRLIPSKGRLKLLIVERAQLPAGN